MKKIKIDQTQTLYICNEKEYEAMHKQFETQNTKSIVFSESELKGLYVFIQQDYVFLYDKGLISSPIDYNARDKIVRAYSELLNNNHVVNNEAIDCLIEMLQNEFDDRHNYTHDDLLNEFTKQVLLIEKATGKKIKNIIKSNK